MAADTVEVEARVQVAETARLDGDVRGLEQDRERRLVHDARLVEERRERAELGRQLLLAEDEERQVDGRLDAAAVELPRELEQHGEPALHVARAEADDRAVLDPARDVLLCGNGVVVAREHDEIPPLAPAASANTKASSPLYSGSKLGGTSETTWAAISASCRLSEGMSTSSSVRSARRSARDGIERKRGIIPV